MSHRNLVFSGLLLISVVSGCGSRSTPDESSAIRPEMLDAFAASQKLFPYVWNPPAFADQRSHREILELLNRLETDFHKVEEVGKPQPSDPGFTVTLKIQQDMLADIRKRFAEGKKDYANWQLRALSGNCVACHTRSNVTNNFLGAAPVAASSSVEDQLAAIDFQLATRQFDSAAEEYLRLARTLASSPSGSADTMLPLKQWLVIQVRVKGEGNNAASQLRDFISHARVHEDQHRILTQWVHDLSVPDTKPVGNSLATAKALLGTAEEQTLEHNEASLVRTLRATTLLHQLLDSTTDDSSRRQAEYLLALAYTRIPIRSFEVFQEPYLEHAIRGNPGSAEAQKAFALYRTRVEEDSTGSSGLNLDVEAKEKLQELKTIAFGQT